MSRHAGVAAALLATALVAACDRGPAPRADSGVAAGSVATPAADSAADTMTIVVRGPTVVAFLPADTPEDLDQAKPDEAAALDDFFFYLSEAMGPLRARGVDVRVRLADSLRFASGARRWAWAPPADSAVIGYYLVSPTRGPHVLHGVRVDADLLDAVATQLGASATTGGAPE